MTTIGHVRSLVLTTLLLKLFLVVVVEGGWVDVDTPLDKRTTQSLVDGSTYHLVMSDEFNVDSRTFKDGHDALWTALDKSDDDASSAGGGSMQFYNSSAVSTENGMLKISTYLEKTEWMHYNPLKKEWKHVQTNITSGMVQSWNKFCFTGGIVEVDIVFPGDPRVGGLWPAVWLLGNLGRATYEASTNNIWPWSFDVCNRDLQQAQLFSACNRENHFGMHPFQGRGATEIDLVEVMSGDSNGPFPMSDPPIALPYADFTLQAAPGVPTNRPQSGALPLKQDITTRAGYTKYLAQTWYDGLELQGNTSINPFFYGTYLAETKPNEPVSRTKEQAFQADAIGTIHQLTPAHFSKPHTFRLEWQPGRGGRLDWFVKNYRINKSTEAMEGDGMGQEWVRAFTLQDKSLKDLMQSQIPNEPSYLILNTAVSSTWGFPYDVPDWCEKCYDCNDPKCACAFNPGFCEMLRQKDNVALLVDSIRVYQTTNHTAHAGNPHSLGCDPLEYPTKDWIDGHRSRYMRNPPFSYQDKGLPLQPVQRGGGRCRKKGDCGGDVQSVNYTDAAGNFSLIQGRGKCVTATTSALFSRNNVPARVCSCREGFTGPHCLSLDHWDHYPSAHEANKLKSPFANMALVHLPPILLVGFAVLAVVFLGGCIHTLRANRISRIQYAPI